MLNRLRPFLNFSNLLLLAIVVGTAVASWLTGHDYFSGGGMLMGAVVAPTVSASDTSNLNTVAADYLEWVDQSKVFDTIWENNPFLTMVSKNSNVAGAYLDNSVIFGGSGGTSYTYANSLGNQTPQKQATFHVPMAELFHIGTLDGHAIAAARQKKGAFVPLVEQAMESGMKLAANKLSLSILSAGTNTLGQIKNIQSNPTGFPTGSARITLQENIQYRAFEYQATYDVTTTDGGAPLGSPDTVTCLAIDAAAGFLVLSVPSSGAWGSGSFVIGKFLIQDGDYQSNAFSSSISTQSGITGFQPQAVAGAGAWVPSFEFRQSPGLAAAQFLNVPRQLDGTRLAGQSFNGTNMAIDKALTGASIQAATFGMDGVGPEYCIMGPTSYNALINLLQGQKLYMDTGSVQLGANINYENVKILQGGAKPMKVMMDPNMPARRAYLFSPDDFELASTGGCPIPMPFDDGRALLSYPNQNGVQYRVGGYVNLVCRKPSNVVNVSLQQ